MTFTMWSFGHILFIISPIVFTIILHQFTKNKSQEEKRVIGLWLSIIAIVILLLRNIEIFIGKGYILHPEIVPLQVCHFANFVLLYAFWRRSDVAFSFSFTLNLLAAFLSIIFADGLENYPTLISFQGFAYITGHALIVVIIAWAFFNDFIFITFKTWIRSVVIVEILIVLSVFINNLFYVLTGFYSNYFYTEHPEYGTPLEWPWNWGNEFIYGSFKIHYIYVLSLMIVFPVITYGWYWVAKAFNKAE